MINGEQLFIQAPTGIGKTLSTVFPAVWAVGESMLIRFLSDSKDDNAHSGSISI